MRKVTKALPVDHTLLSESVQCHLLQGDVPRVRHSRLNTRLLLTVRPGPATVQRA